MNSNEISDVLGKVPCFKGVYAADEFSKIMKLNRKSPAYAFIINTDPSWKPGSHWVAFYIDGKSENVEFFDSFGYHPQISFLTSDYFTTYYSQYVKKKNIRTKFKFKTNKQRIQATDSDSCGLFCCMYVYLKCECRLKIKSFCRLFNTNFQNNESKVSEFFHRAFGIRDNDPHSVDSSRRVEGKNQKCYSLIMNLNKRK